jgi:ACS family hexuronate transporter-like MFS transporter
VLSPTVLAATGLSAESYSQAITAFSIAYMIGNPLWGSFLDYFGLRRGMLMAVGVWTVASLSHSWVMGFVGFAIARAVLGFGEGATFPGALRTAHDSLPPDRQSRGMAVSYSGASLGALVTPLIVTPIALTWGWQAAFLFTGGLGALWMLVWLKVAKPPLLPSTRGETLRIKWPDLTERRFWQLAVSFGFGGVALGPIANLAPVYLNRVMGLSQAELGRVLWIPALGWEIGYFFWGWVADRFVGENPRPVKVYLLMAVLALPTSLVTLMTSWQAVMALFFWAMFMADGFVVVSMRLGSRAYSRDHTGMAAGIGSGAWSAVVALTMLLYGRWFDRQMYTTIFVTLSLSPALGTALWLLLRPKRA